jgi:dienelactone hydrolase
MIRQFGARYLHLKFVTAVLMATLLVASAGTALAAIKTEAVAYKEGQAEAHSFIVYDDALSGKRPGVLVVPEWWGLNDYPKMRAKMLAELGYVAMAVDIYGDGKTTADPKQAGAWADALEAGDRAELRTRIAAALARLKSDPRVDPSKTAAIGYCFGGSTVLELARSGATVNGVVSFHGHYDTNDPAKPGEVKAKVLACHGADDPFQSPAQYRRSRTRCARPAPIGSSISMEAPDTASPIRTPASTVFPRWPTTRKRTIARGRR